MLTPGPVHTERLERAGAAARAVVAETIANLRELRQIAGTLTGTAWVWLTPVPVDEERLSAYPPFQYGHSTWRNEDIDAPARDIHEIDAAPVVDLVRVFGIPAD